MMTLDDLFGFATMDLSSRIKSALPDGAFCVKVRGIENLAISRWQAFPTMAAQHLGKLFDIGMGDILAGAWNKARSIRQSLEKSKKSPGKEILLELAEHKITSKHEPSLAILRNGVQVASLKFFLNLELTIQGAVLRILDGEIRGMQVGQIKGKGTLKAGSAILVEKELGPVEIPGTMALAH